MEQENSLIPEEEIKNPEILETSTNDEPVVAESKAVENAKEKKEVPEIDFSILSTEEIIRQAQKLINDYPVVSLKEIFEGLPEIFESRYKEEYEKALAIFTADGDKPEVSNTKTTTGNVSMPSTSSIKIKKTLQPGKRKPNAKKI